MHKNAIISEFQKEQIERAYSDLRPDLIQKLRHCICPCTQTVLLLLGFDLWAESLRHLHRNHVIVQGHSTQHVYLVGMPPQLLGAHSGLLGSLELIVAHPGSGRFQGSE